MVPTEFFIPSDRFLQILAVRCFLFRGDFGILLMRPFLRHTLIVGCLEAARHGVHLVNQLRGVGHGVLLLGRYRGNDGRGAYQILDFQQVVTCK